MSFISQGYEQLVSMVIRPPRYTYDISDLGPPRFKVGPVEYIRKDLELTNPRGLTIQCSHYFLNRDDSEKSKKRPCVIYCHGNSGCRLDGLEAVKILLPLCSVFTFDFTGCGISQGEYVSLGYYEREDLQTVVNYLRSCDTISRIGLWGRSMGAATSIFYASQDPSIAGMVLDSPFYSLKRLCEELSGKVNVKIPKLVVSVGIKILRRSIKQRAKFDIEDLCPHQYVGKCYIPALFCHGKEDDFVLPHHSQDLFKKYAGDKNLLLVDGNHNSIRPDFMYDSVSIFFHNLLFDKDDKTELAPVSSHQHRGRKISPLEASFVSQSIELETNTFSDIGAPEIDSLEEDEEADLRRAIEESLKLVNHKPEGKREALFPSVANSTEFPAFDEKAEETKIISNVHPVEISISNTTISNSNSENNGEKKVDTENDLIIF